MWYTLKKIHPKGSIAINLLTTRYFWHYTFLATPRKWLYLSCLWLMNLCFEFVNALPFPIDGGAKWIRTHVNKETRNFSIKERKSRSTTENTIKIPLIHTILPLSFCFLVSYLSYGHYYSNDVWGIKCPFKGLMHAQPRKASNVHSCFAFYKCQT